MSRVFELTRRLIDIESITGNEKQVGDFVHELLSGIAHTYGGTVERMEVEPGRDNIFAAFGEPYVTMSTHLDTVPPYFPSSEDDEFIWGRGACDVKDIIAAMICAAENLLADGVRGFALLFVVGEERDSAGPTSLADIPAARDTSSTANQPATGWRRDRRARCALC
jgi:acetylornithine deacetylase